MVGDMKLGDMIDSLVDLENRWRGKIEKEHAIGTVGHLRSLLYDYDDDVVLHINNSVSCAHEVIDLKINNEILLRAINWNRAGINHKLKSENA